MKTENNLNGQSEHPLITIQEKKKQLWEIVFCNVSKDRGKKFPYTSRRIGINLFH